MADMARAVGATLSGEQKLLGKKSNFVYSFLNLYFALHTTINNNDASTRVPMYYVGSVASAPPSIMTKLRY